MSFASLLTHTITIERPFAPDVTNLDDYGHIVPGTPTTRSVRASIQPKSEREMALTTDRGAAISDHTIYLLPVDVTTSDTIVHDASACPADPDLPDARFEIRGVPNAAGLGHHLELDAHLVSAGEAIA